VSSPNIDDHFTIFGKGIAGTDILSIFEISGENLDGTGEALVKLPMYGNAAYVYTHFSSSHYPLNRSFKKRPNLAQVTARLPDYCTRLLAAGALFWCGKAKQDFPAQFSTFSVDNSGDKSNFLGNPCG
jgi:hypothetical protein